MATHRMSILGAATLPDTSGNVWFEPAALTQTNDRYPQMVARFKDSTTKDVLGGNFVVPKNFVSAPKIYVLWTSTATTGNAVWTFDYAQIAAAGSLDPLADTETATATSAAPATSQSQVQSSLSLTAANLTAGELVQFKLGRNGAGADTLAADAVVYGLVFEYADA